MGQTINGIPFTQLRLSSPQSGPWVATCRFPIVTAMGTTKAPTAGSTATIVVDKQSFTGTFESVDLRDAGEAVTRIVGGKGGATRTLSARSWSDGPQARLVAQALLSSTGEALATSLSDRPTLQAFLRSFVALGGTTLSQAMAQLCRSLSCFWRFDPATGQAFLTRDASVGAVKLPTKAVLEDAHPGARATYQVPALDVMPALGSTDPNAGDAVVREVEVVCEGTDLLVTLRYVQQGSLVPDASRADALRHYVASVVSQGSDGSIEAQPDDPRFAGSSLKSLPVRLGAGVKWQVNPGERCTVAFEDGDLSRPYVAGLDSASSGLQSATFGDPSTAQFVALSNVVDSNFDNVKTAAQAGLDAVVAQDGGKAAFTAFIAALDAASTAATRLKTQ